MHVSRLSPIDQLETDLLAMAQTRTPAWLQAQLAKGAYIYGAGNFGRRVAGLLRAQGHTCLGMIDQKAGSGVADIDGVALIHPDELTPALCAGKVLLLGIFNPYNDMGEIVRTMRARGFAEILWGADLPDALGPSIGEFWLSGRQIFVDQLPRIRAAYDIFSDPASRQALEEVIRFRALNDDRPGFVPSPHTQYFPPDLPGFGKPISFLDGGAYDGDTFRTLRAFGVEIESWLAFEPDPQNFAKLAAFAQNCGVRASAIPCGLAARTGQLRFAAGNDTGSRLVGDAEAGVTIQCLAVDEAFANTPIDYMKLDIEGAEAAALEGMRATIAKYRPRLAISAYHRPADIWDIALQLKSLLPDANIHMRQHYPNTYEIVTYAVPPGR